ncbi:hypothetical protein TNCT_701451 [Trichonephila clavata]|uniref:Uncharacterized protein n=1 Tax=Trichonephila clavata TaxID=2740835 RepID=A0A8X6F465_TRICU|nr:hypothetical protein TNCT_701451 [Trichonephila clavata]
MNETVDLQRTGQPSIPQNQIDILSGLLFADRRWIVPELSLVVDLSHQKGVAHNEEISGHMRKIVAGWVPHQLP